MAKVLIAPNGKRIRGTLETMRGCALVADARESPADGGRFELRYSGETCNWDEEQLTELDGNGERLFVDEAGEEWPESQLRLVDESEVEDTDA